MELLFGADTENNNSLVVHITNIDTAKLVKNILKVFFIILTPQQDKLNLKNINLQVFIYFPLILKKYLMRIYLYIKGIIYVNNVFYLGVFLSQTAVLLL